MSGGVNDPAGSPPNQGWGGNQSQPGHSAGQAIATDGSPNYPMQPVQQHAPQGYYPQQPPGHSMQQGYPQQNYQMPHGYGHPQGSQTGSPINIVVQSTNTVGAGGGLVRVGNKSRMIAALLAFFLGGLGVHKFYLGRTMMGVLYLVFCWTLIPAFIAFIDFVVLLLSSDLDFDLKYNTALAR